MADRRHPFIVMSNVKNMLSQEASDDELSEYVKSEGFTMDEMAKMPAPRNLEQMADITQGIQKAGDVLKGTPGPIGEVSRTEGAPKFLQSAAEPVGQIAGNITGLLTGGPVGSKVGGVAGALIGKTVADSIKLARGETVTPEQAMRELVQTGGIATASELAFGAGSKGEKVLSKAFEKAGKLTGPALKGFTDKLFAATSGKLTNGEVGELLERGVTKVLTPKNMGKSIDLGVVNKATNGLNKVKRMAGESFKKIVDPLINNKNLIVPTNEISDAFTQTLKKFRFIDDAGKPISGLIDDVSTKEAEELLGILKKLNPDEPVTFGKLHKTRQEIDALLSFSKGTQTVKPKSSVFEGALKELRGDISNSLRTVGGDDYAKALDEFTDTSNLFDDLQKILNNPEKAERTLETVLSGKKQIRFENFKKLNDRLPANEQFMDDLIDFDLAQKFTSESFNLIRWGIVGGLLGAKGLSSGGPLGGVAGLGSAFFLTTPKGIGQVLKLQNKVGEALSPVKPLIGQLARAAKPATVKTFGELLADSRNKNV